jgi:hypothetical protein
LEQVGYEIRLWVCRQGIYDRHLGQHKCLVFRIWQNILDVSPLALRTNSDCAVPALHAAESNTSTMASAQALAACDHGDSVSVNALHIQRCNAADHQHSTMLVMVRHRAATASAPVNQLSWAGAPLALPLHLSIDRSAIISSAQLVDMFRPYNGAVSH